MGTSTSTLQEIFSDALAEEQITTLLSRDINKLTYDEFLKLLGELNELSKKYLDNEGNQLIFAVKKDSDSTVFWKATVEIACVKIEGEKRKVLSHRIYSLSQFLKVYKTIKCGIMAAEQSKGTDISEKETISKLFGNACDIVPNECCICLERKQELSLPCAHSFCKKCIEEWNESHNTCPICREKLESTDEAWLMWEVPEAEEISQEIRKNLIELSEEKPSLCTPS